MKDFFRVNEGKIVWNGIGGEHVVKMDRGNCDIEKDMLE